MLLSAWIDRCVDMGLPVDAAAWATLPPLSLYETARMDINAIGCGYANGHGNGDGEGSGYCDHGHGYGGGAGLFVPHRLGSSAGGDGRSVLHGKLSQTGD